MSSQTLHIDNLLVDNAVTLWRKGELVAMPTETVYGLGADATNGEAVARIYSTKARPQFNPLIVHVADVATAKHYVEWPEVAETLAAKFWPGPLTLVLKRRVDCPISELVSAGGETLAIRIPAHPVALQLLKAFGGGIAAPSANRSGRVSPTTAQHVRDEFGDDLPLIIDGGPCVVGLESTVLDLSGEVPMILRPGAVTIEEVTLAIEGGLSPHATLPPAASGSLTLRTPTTTTAPQLRSPGMLESHYAPSIPVRLNADGAEAGEALLAFGPAPIAGAAACLNLSATSDLIEAAANLFAYLRALDNAAHRAIAVMPIPNTGVGIAINDRLARASAPR